MNAALAILDRLAKYICSGLLIYAVYHLVEINLLEPMYFYALVGSALTGLGIHAAVVTPYSKQLVSPLQIQLPVADEATDKPADKPPGTTSTAGNGA